MEDFKNHIEALIFCEFCKQSKVNPQKVDLIYIKLGLIETSRRLFPFDETDLYFRYGCLIGFYGKFACLPIKYACEILYEEYKECKRFKNLKMSDQDLIKELVRHRFYSKSRYKSALKAKKYRDKKIIKA